MAKSMCFVAFFTNARSLVDVKLTSLQMRNDEHKQQLGVNLVVLGSSLSIPIPKINHSSRDEPGALVMSAVITTNQDYL